MKSIGIAALAAIIIAILMLALVYFAPTYELLARDMRAAVYAQGRIDNSSGLSISRYRVNEWGKSITQLSSWTDTVPSRVTKEKVSYKIIGIDKVKNDTDMSNKQKKIIYAIGQPRYLLGGSRIIHPTLLVLSGDSFRRCSYDEGAVEIAEGALVKIR